MLPIAGREGRVDLRAGFRKLTAQRSYLSFLGAMALLGIGTSSYVNFLGLHMLALGGNETAVGLAWAANGIFEFPVMLLGARWFARFRYGRVILFAFAGYVLVWLAMAMVTAPAQLVLLCGLTGVCYGMLWVSAVNYASEAAPPGLGATAQALVGAAQAGIGWSLGAVIAGYLWDASGGSAVFLVAALAAGAGGVLFWLGNRTPQAAA
jgi:MFS family permease